MSKDTTDDQLDIQRGRGMVDPKFQGKVGLGGTHNMIQSSSSYISTGLKQYDNFMDGFYISPSFLDKMTVHIAKNFIELPKIKVPLILGIWGGKVRASFARDSFVHSSLHSFSFSLPLFPFFPFLSLFLSIWPSLPLPSTLPSHTGICAPPKVLPPPSPLSRRAKARPSSVTWPSAS